MKGPLTMRMPLGFDLAGAVDRRLWWGLLWGALGAVADAVPWALLVALPLLMVQDGSGMSPVWLLAIMGLAGFVLGSGLKALALNANFSSTYTMVAQARLRLADHVARLPLGRVLNWRDGAISDLLSSKFSLYQDIMTHVWGLVVAGLTFPVLLWAMLLLLDWRLALVYLAFVPVAMLAIPWSYRLLDAAAARVSAERDLAVAGVVEVVGGARDLAFFDPQDRRRQAVHQHFDALSRASLATEVAPAPALASYALVLNVAVVAVMLLADHWLRDGSLAPMVLCLALFLVLRLNGAVAEFGLFLAELRFARAVLSDIRALANEPPLPQTKAAVQPVGGEIQFEDVSFAYDGQAVIRGLSARLPAGTVTALVGPSGAGKSTLAHLVGRLWDVQAGAIRIGGVDLRQMDEATLNRTVSMVLQDVTLFPMTLADNIRLGRPEASDDEVMAAAEAACIHQRIMDLPSGYQTVFDPEAVRLSGGEQQRVAIARALLKDAPVLILDEATASIDLDSEALVQQALSRLCAGRTVLVIAHRLWTIRHADLILVMQDGDVIERGTHPELIDSRGTYARLWQAQQGR